MKYSRMAVLIIVLSLSIIGVISSERFSAKTNLTAQESSPKVPSTASNQQFADTEFIATTIDRHPIYSHNGKTYVWAKGKRNTMDTIWFDMTDSLLNPEELKHGIGKDTIASIDKPMFLKPDDPALDTWVHPRRTRLGPIPVRNETPVIGVEIDGEARAYPVMYLDRHELVNDVFGEAHVTVAW